MYVIILAAFLATGLWSPTQARTKVVNESGWEIPGFIGAEVAKPRSQYHRPPEDLFITTLRPREGAVTKILDVTSQPPDSLPIREECWDVLRLEALDVNRNIFCYLVTLGGLRNCADPMAPVLGWAIEYQYYDMDGDGRFEIREKGSLFLPTFDPPIPGWVRTKSR